MAIEAPYSKFKKTNIKIWIALFVGLAIMFAYDGYLSQYEWSFRRSFYEEHVKDGIPDKDMVLNQKLPFALIPLAMMTTVWLWVVRNKKLIANDHELVISDKKKIPYDSIEKIDKTHFKPRTQRQRESNSQGEGQELDGPPEGYFIITYKNKDGREVNCKLSDKAYDNLGPILDLLVAKIS